MTRSYTLTLTERELQAIVNRLHNKTSIRFDPDNPWTANHHLELTSKLDALVASPPNNPVRDVSMDALGDSVAALASIAGLAQAAMNAGVSALTAREEAPAEGVGELIQRIVGNCGGFVPKGEDLRLCVEALEAALRARTQAPES